MSERLEAQTVADLLEEVAKGSRYNSAHEAYAVIREELDELWDEIRRKDHKRDNDKLEAEALQVAATALRFVLELREWREAMGD